MTWIAVFSIAVALGMDAFAVAISVGGRCSVIRARPLLRLSFHFGLFQFLMPVLGWYLGSRIDQYISAYDHWLAFGLLAVIGVKMIKESRSEGGSKREPVDPTRGWTLILLSVATSIDALAVGLSLAFLGIEVWTPSLVIGLVAMTMTAVGMVFGRKLGSLFGKRMELVGGLILIGIGVKILLEHSILN